MNKIVKYICIGAAIAVGAGIIIALIGRAFSGSVNLETFSVGSTITVTADDCINEKTELKEFSSLRMDATMIDIEVVKGDKYELEINVPEEFIPEVTEEGGKLYIKQPKNENISMNIVNAKLYYKITVPDDDVIDTEIIVTSGDVTVKDVNLEGMIQQTSGDSNISGVRSGKLVLKATSGSTMIQDAEVDSIEVGRTSGDVNLRGVKSSSLDIEATSGEIEIDDSDISDVSVEVTSGDVDAERLTVDNFTVGGTSAEVDLHLVGNVEDYDFDINTTSGDIEVGGVSSEHSYKTNAGKDKKINISTTSGDVEIAF